MKKFKVPKLTKHALIIFLLWAFAPAAWFLLWKDKKYHSWFPKLLWVNGIIFSIIFFTQSFIFIPKLEQIYDVVGIEVPPSTTPLAAFLVLVFVLLQIPAGIHLQKKIIKHKSLTDKYVIPILFIFLIDGIIAFSTGLVSAVQSPSAFAEKYLMYKAVPTIEEEIPLPTINTMPYFSPTPTPTPRPLTFSEMNQMYGPCVNLPTLMYHHVEDMEIAKKNNRVGLDVAPSTFRSQMEYLSQKGYLTVTPSDLINFFNTGTSIPKKSVLITFDDAYDDFYFNAYPVLKEFNLKATMFAPTGLIGNPGYLTWDQINQMTQLVTFGNHTWSHKEINKGTKDNITYEIVTADGQLSSHGLNNPKVFAYPYGPAGSTAEAILSQNGYQIAFTTTPGRVLCKKLALTLPRVRVGNSTLNVYGI